MRLTQVFTNLLDNAAKHTDRGGHIHITLESASGQAVARVRDTGAGIGAELLPHVFDLFRQGRTSSNANQTGLGVGLALVKSLVELHGGSVEAASDGPGSGSEFTVRLPLAEASSPIRHEPRDDFLKDVGEPLVGRRVLVVDDNRDAADATAEFLRILGADVRVAYGGEEALQAANEHRPSVVLLDLGMPRVDGFEVARAIRREDDAGVRLVALTGWGQPHDRQRTREAGFDRHLVKPADPQDLVAAVLDP
ncbi:MAG: response regulator, partial [Rhizobacter sp.]|nr:response regulator [Rhizobacter sp.]